MAEREVEFLLIGGGMASAHCAARLRERGAEGDVLLVGREPEPPYERPPLSKEYLRASAERSDALVHAEGWYEENGVELRTRTNVMSLDAGERTAKLQGGEEVRVRQGADRDGRERAHPAAGRARSWRGSTTCGRSATPDAIRADAEEAERVVLIGGSYIGCEVAASLTAQGTSARS